MHDPARPPRRHAGLALVLALASLAPAAARACSAEPFLGDMCVTAANYCPENYVIADGRLLAIKDYTALYVTIWTYYGGDGKTTFALPDLRGRTPVGQGTGQIQVDGKATPLPAIDLAQKLGQPAVVLSTAQAPMPMHTHDATFTAQTGAVDVALPATDGDLAVEVTLPVAAVATGAVSVPPAAAPSLASISAMANNKPVVFNGPYTQARPSSAPSNVTLKAAVSGEVAGAAAKVKLQTITGGAVTVQPSGSAPAAPAPIQSPALGLTTCIAFQGYYPSRP